MKIEEQQIQFFAQKYSQLLGLPGLQAYISDELHSGLQTTPILRHRIALFGQPDNQVAENEKILNNGLGHTRNPALIWHDHFRFRHISEVYFYLSFKDRGKVIAPLSVIGQINQRREIDYGLFENNRYSAVQLDGPSHDGVSAEEEDQRMSMLLRQGFNIIRVRHRGIWDHQWCALRRDLAIALHHYSRDFDIEATTFSIDFELEELMNDKNNLQKEIEKNVYDLHLL